MGDKPQEPSNAANKEFCKYVGLFAIAVITLNLLIVCLLVFAIFFMPLKETTLKLPETGDEAKMRLILEHADTRNEPEIRVNINSITKKLTELEATVHKELKMKVGKLEDRLNDNDIQKTCDEDESTCIHHDDNLKEMMNVLEKRIDTELKSKVAELEKHLDTKYTGQMSTKSESAQEYFMKKLAEMESRLTNGEMDKKLSELENRLDSVQDLLGEKKYVVKSSNGKAVESASYPRLFLRVILWIVALVVFIGAGLVACLIVKDIYTNNLRADLTERLVVYGVLLCCLTVVFGGVYFTSVYTIYGRDELFASLKNVLFTSQGDSMTA